MQDVLNLFRDFDHDEQARLCARHLELLRNDLGDAWWDYPKDERRQAVRRNGANSPKGSWTREHVGLAGHLIRHAGESADFPLTVDFVTAATLEHIQVAHTASRRRTSGNLKQWSLFTHEHMVPGQAVLRLITDEKHPASHGELQPFLAALSLRALVTGTKRKRAEGWTRQEVNELDDEWSYRLPKPSEIDGWRGAKDLAEIQPQFYGLMRYEAASLLHALIPVSRRGKRVLSEYLAYRGN